jgi:hypothetical protein
MGAPPSTALFQQPNDDPTVVPSLNAPVLVAPVVKPVMEEVAAEPELGATPIPAHGVVVMVGPRTPIIGLMPALPISVAPRGIVPPESADEAFATGFDSGDAVPVDDVRPDAVEVQLPEVEAPIPVVPPPSKVELAPVAADPACPFASIPEADVPVVRQLEPPAIEPIGTGLKPPGSISVAPRGMPVGDPEEVEPGMPSGDVAPSPDVPIVLWASAAALLSRIAAATNNNRRIGTSCGFPVGKRRCSFRLFEIASETVGLRAFRIMRAAHCVVAAKIGSIVQACLRVC